MRLLEYNESGELSIRSFNDSDIPPYAILSHTWGADGDEVTFADLQTLDGGKTKPGYEKIIFCGKQAQRDNLQYFWTDTCCIDKTDQNELSIAIRSMFRWYQKAAKCYVYLSDVLANEQRSDEMFARPWEPAFRSSRWFTRGWTLQELLAPSKVEFFTREGEMLGDKTSLTPLISKITGIPPQVLQGRLAQFDIEERLRWRGHRKTKLEEDMAYSLSGICDVDIAPVYGEGEKEAFRRLHYEIRRLKDCMRDLFSSNPYDDKKRIEDTKGGLLADSYRWVLNNTTFQQWQQHHHTQLLWINGDPGKGKTMLLCGIINELQQTFTPQSTVLAYFFCQAADPRINSATAVLRGLLYMLVTQQPSLMPQVLKKYDIAGRASFEDANAWVVLSEILEDTLRDPHLRPTYLIIDALDECVTELPRLLELIVKQSSRSSRVKWIVSSRNRPDIKELLEQRAGHQTTLSLELNAESVSAAVDVFIKRKVDQLAREKQYKAETQAAVLQHLTSNANNTFLWVALVCQELRRRPKWNVLRRLAQFPPGLDFLYERMLQQITDSDGEDILLRVLAVTAVLYRPVTVPELVVLTEQLADFDDKLETAREIISACGSFLTLRDDTVYFVHHSAKEFLCLKGLDKVLPHGIKGAHREVFSKSLTYLSKTLRRNMYDLVAPDFLVDKIVVPISESLDTMRYPCLYWIEHLVSTAGSVTCSADGLQDGRAVDVFFRKKYLHWLEALSLYRNMSMGVTSLAKLEILLQGNVNLAALNDLVRDAHQFVLRNRGIIEKYPLQAYYSALVFTMDNSLIRKSSEMELPPWFRKISRIHKQRNPCKQILENHYASVNAAIFLPDNWRLASASSDKTIRLWDTRTSGCEQVFMGHESAVHDVAASPDGLRLASASNDKTVRLWEVGTEECIFVLAGHRSSVRTVAFSPDGKWLASGSNDKTIRVWNAMTYEFERALQQHRSGVNDVVFSPDSSLLASASNDKTVRLWSTTIFDCCITLSGHSSEVYSLAFSPDNQQLVSASNDKTIRIWDTDKGECKCILQGHDSGVTSVAFSFDTLRLASGSNDKTVCLWDIKKGICENRFEGHQNSITSVAFSANSEQLVSASKDHMLRVWSTIEHAVEHSTTGHNGSVNTVSFSPDGSWFVTASVDGDIRLWDTASIDCIHVLEGHHASVYAAEFSQDCNRLASASRDKTIRVWNTHTGLIEQILEGHDSDVYAVAFSPNGQWIASGSNDESVRLWDVEYGDCVHLFEGHRASIHSVAFSLDSQQLVSASKDQTIRFWNTSTGSCERVVNIREATTGLIPAEDCRVTANDSKALRLSTAISTSAASGLAKQDSTVLSGQLVLSNEQLTRRVHVEDDWVFQNGQRLLWLPPDCRPSCSAVQENLLVMGHGSGGITCIEFDF